MVSSVMQQLLSIIPPLPWHHLRRREAEGDRVVLLHGLWRSVWAMEGLASYLNKEGLETLNIPYPSFRKSLDEIVDLVIRSIPPSGKPTHFVTHSMGGIVLRALARKAPHLVTGKITMLAPPNQGSEIIDWLEDSFVGPAIFGPGGMSLSTENIQRNLPGFPDELDVSVIMGRTTHNQIFQPLLCQEHDGIVTVEGGKVRGMKHFEVINAAHTLIMNNPEARELTLRHLTSPIRKNSAAS